MTHDTTIEFLKRNGRIIRERAEGGDKNARSVMSVYEMYHNHTDHCTLGLLQGAIDSYVGHSDWH